MALLAETSGSQSQQEGGRMLGEGVGERAAGAGGFRNVF